VADIEAQMLLCDAAVADQGGKLHMLGAGWSITSSPTSPQAVAVLLKIPWDRANERLALMLRLVDDDGRPVAVATTEGSQELTMGGDIETGRPPGVTPGLSGVTPARLAACRVRTEVGAPVSNITRTFVPFT